MAGRLMLVVAGLVVVACSEPPLAEDGGSAAGAQSLTVPGLIPMPAGCTRRWAHAVDGEWNDPDRWFPVGTPKVADSVCINAIGTYEVTLDVPTWPEPDYLRVGGYGVAATLLHDSPAGGRMEVAGDVNVRAGSELVIVGFDTMIMIGGNLINDGVIRVTGCSCAEGMLIFLDGTGISGPTVDFTNNGTLDLAGRARILLLGNPPQGFSRTGARGPNGSQTARPSAHVHTLLQSGRAIGGQPAKRGSRRPCVED